MYRTKRISLCSLYDAFNRANLDAVWRVVMILALYAGSLIDHIQDTVAFGDRLCGAFGDASATGNAFFSNLHGHRKPLLCENYHQN